MVEESIAGVEDAEEPVVIEVLHVYHDLQGREVREELVIHGEGSIARFVGVVAFGVRHPQNGQVMQMSIPFPFPYGNVIDCFRYYDNVAQAAANEYVSMQRKAEATRIVVPN